MGRIHFLMKTLPHNLKLLSNYDSCELVLLDYNSKDGLEDWIKNNFQREISSGLLVYVKTTQPEHFHMSHAKNLVHRLASGKVLCNLDADNFLEKMYINELYRCFEEEGDNFILKARGDGHGAGGRIAVSSDLFYKVRGYEEHIDRWGHDDTDFFNKCEIFKGKVIGYLPQIRVIRHSDDVRGSNYEQPFNRNQSRKWAQKLKNRIKSGKIQSNLNRSFGKGYVKKNFTDSVRIEEDLSTKIFETKRYRLVYNTGLANYVFVYPELGSYIMTIVKNKIGKLNCYWFDKGEWIEEGDTIKMNWFCHSDSVLHKEPDSEKYRCDKYFIKRT